MLEKDLVEECKQVADAMGAFLALIGQRKAKGSGTTRGVPDMLLMCAGEVRLIELKRPATPENPKGFLSLAQTCFIARAAEMGVTVHVVDNLPGFVSVLNSCRASHGVQRLATR
jgi:hypothetical protein